VEEGAVATSHLSRKKIIFVPKGQSDKFVCIFTQFLTGRKHAVIRSLGTRILRFNPATKLTITTQKLSKKITVGRGDGGRPIVPS